MRKTRSAPRGILLALPVAAILLAAPALAAAAVTPTGVTDTIHIELKKGALKFVGPKTVTQGDDLTIVNDTSAKQVGPHTFSLVTKGSVPRTRGARQNCFTPKHICLAIARWHGLNKREEVTINPAKAGAEGWSTMGTVKRKGDSWFTGFKKGASFTQQVTANGTTEPKTLYFICAVHPWMHGSVQVEPAPLAPIPLP